MVPDRDLNFLLGANGQGKTSFLEALSFLATLKSFRGAKTDEVIRWGHPAGEVHCTLVKEDWTTELKISFMGDENRSTKLAFINGKPFRSSTQYLTQRFGAVELGFHTIVFNPSDHDLVRGEPSIRRSYLDRVVSAEDIEYLSTLQKYQRVLQQRNSLLKMEDSPNRQVLRGFTEQLASYGSLLTFKRLEWLERLSEILPSTIQDIAPQQSMLCVKYISNWAAEMTDFSSKNKDFGPVHFAGQEARASLETLERLFWKKASALEEAELRSRSSLVGPHRDDWTFQMGEHVLKGHGSQGEVRSALLALKLSEIELFKVRTGHQPLLLLDDFSSELDESRRANLLSYLIKTGLQIFVTATEDQSFLGKQFRVSQGRLQEVSERGVHDPTEQRSESGRLFGQ